MGFGVQLYYISRFKSYCKQVFQKEAKWLFTPFQCLQYLRHTFDSCAVLLAQFLALDYLYGAICAFKRMKSALDSSRKYKTKKAVPPPSIWQLNKLVSCIFYYPQKSGCRCQFFLEFISVSETSSLAECLNRTNYLFLFLTFSRETKYVQAKKYYKCWDPQSPAQYSNCLEQPFD